MGERQRTSCSILCCLPSEKAVSRRALTENIDVAWTPSRPSACSRSLCLKRVDGPFRQGRNVPPYGLSGGARYAAQIPKLDPLGWCGCNVPDASSTLLLPPPQATDTTKEARQIGEERKTPRFTTATNKGALFTRSGIHICFVLFSMTTGCEQRSRREEH